MLQSEIVAKSLATMMQTRSFQTQADLDEYWDAFVRLRNAATPEQLSAEELSGLLLVLSDAEYGGHGVWQQMFSYISSSRIDLLSRAVTSQFDKISSAAPECLSDILAFLCAPPGFPEMARAIEGMREPEQSRIRHSIRNVATQMGWQTTI